MSERRRAELNALGLFILASVLLTVIGRLLGTPVGDPSVVGAVLLLIGFASIGVFIWVLFRIERRYPR